MFIYQILNVKTGMSYIGQTRNKKARITHHKTALKNNRHKNSYLQNAYNKYGVKCFEFNIIECLLLKTQDYINEREQWWLDNTVGLYNIRKSAKDMIYPNCQLNNPFKNKSHTKKTKKILSEAGKKRIGNLNSFYGKNHTQAVKDNLSKSAKKRLKDKTKHPMYDSTIYNFYNETTKVHLQLTQQGFIEYLEKTTGVVSKGNVCSLTKGNLKSYKGFGLKF